MPTMPGTFRAKHQQARSDQKREYDRRRDSEAPHRTWVKSRRWKKLREVQLSIEPLCRMCSAENKITIAVICDHVEPHRGDEAKFWSGPFQSLCKPHHDLEKQREEQDSRPTRRVGG